MTRYQRPTSTRRESRTITGRFRGGKLAPVMATVLRESESCMLAQSVTMELDPIAGRMITPITAEIIAVAVPIQAIDALKSPEGAYPGNTEVLREKLLSGVPLFGLENENEISKRLGVVPRSIAGVKKVNEVARLAHNCAVNFLRQRKYINAVQLLASNMGVTPALISQTVLQRLNGVLDPEDRVNGAVNLSFGDIKLPVGGFGIRNLIAGGPVTLNETGGKVVSYPASVAGNNLSAGADAGASFPKIYADLAGASAGAVSLVDFYNAQRMDELVRMMRKMADENPEYGEEMIQRWAHGLSVDMGKTPILLHESTQIFGQAIASATDSTGVNTDVMRSDMTARVAFTLPVPATELGCVIITFCAVKPDESIASQPHPFLSDVWGAENYVAAELALDPIPVSMRELHADVAMGSEGTVAFYTGLNELKRAYINYGFNRHIDKNTVANKTAIWQLEVPLSVTPETVLYPVNLGHYPFADQLAEICTYTITSVQTVNTPIVFGPTPVEELAVIETADIFEDAP